MARLNARWFNFAERGQRWYAFWQDTTTGAPAITGAGATTQASQTAAAAGKLRFIATGADAQAAQTASGAARLAFRSTGADAQGSQTAAAAGKERFIASGTDTQSAQTASGASLLRFISTGTPIQASQSATGAGSQAGGAAPVEVFAGPRHGAAIVTGRAKAYERPKLRIVGAGETTQEPQTARGRGWVTDIEAEYALLMAA